jgi:hypothetical protein
LQIDLHFLLRPRPILVVYQIADYDLSNIEVTRKERLTGNFSNIPLYESPSQGNLLQSSSYSDEYESSSPLSYSDESDCVRGLPKEAHSFNSANMLVHFTLCVSQVQIAVCKELRLDPEAYTLYKETADASGIFLFFLIPYLLLNFREQWWS